MAVPVPCVADNEGEMGTDDIAGIDRVSRHSVTDLFLAAVEIA